MDQNEPGVSAYLDYFAASSRPGEGESCSVEAAGCSCEESTDQSDQADDDDYDPAEDIDYVEDGDTTSSEDWECVLGKRKRRNVSKWNRRRTQESFPGQSLSNGFSTGRNISGKGGLARCVKRVGYVNNSSACGEPSKTILRNILESPSASSLPTLSSLKSRNTFFSPCLQALLTKKPEVVLGSNRTDCKSKSHDVPVVNGSGQSHSSNGVLTSSSVSVGGTDNIIPGSASSILVTLLKKAHSKESTSQSLVSKQDCNSQVSNNKQKTLDPIKSVSNINTADTVPNDCLNSQVSCDICKRKCSAAVSLRLVASDDSSADMKQWKLCEQCEVKIVESTATGNQSASQLITKLVCGEKLLTTAEPYQTKGIDKHLRECDSSKLKCMLDAAQSPNNQVLEYKQHSQHGFQTRDYLSTGSELWKTFQNGFRPSENTESHHLFSNASTGHIWEGNQIKDVSKPITKTDSNLKSLVTSSNNMVVKTEPPDDYELNTCSNSEQICNKDLMTDSVVVKKEPADYITEQDASVGVCEQMSNKKLHSGGISVIGPGTDNASFKYSEKIHNKEFHPFSFALMTPSCDNGKPNANVSSGQTSNNFCSGTIKIEPMYDIDQITVCSSKQIPSILMESPNAHSFVTSSVKEFVYDNLKVESLDDSIDHSTSLNFSKQMPNSDSLAVELKYVDKCSTCIDSDEMSNKEFLSGRIKVDPCYDTDNHNTSVTSSAEVNNRESELTELEHLPHTFVVKQEPVENYQAAASLNTAACGIHDSSTLQDLLSPRNTLNNAVNSRSDQFTSILSQLLNPPSKETAVNIGYCKSNIHSQSPKSNHCFPSTFTEVSVSSKDQHSDSCMCQTSNDELSVPSSSLQCCEKQQTAQSSFKNSVPQNMLLSLLQKPIGKEETCSTDYLNMLSGKARTEFTGLNVKSKLVNVSKSSSGVESRVNFTRSQLCSIPPTGSCICETRSGIFQNNFSISHDFDILETDQHIYTADSSITHRDSKSSYRKSNILHRDLIIPRKNSVLIDSIIPESHGRPDFGASDVFEKTCQSSASAVPKSSSLLLQQLCKNHQTRTAGNEDSSLSRSPFDNVGASFCNLQNPTLVRALKAPASYKLSELLLQLRQSSTQRNDASNSGSVISQRADICTSGIEITLSSDIAEIPGPASSSKSAQGYEGTINEAVDSAENVDLSPERVTCGIQPRNAFQNKTVVMSEELKQRLDVSSSKIRSRDNMESSDVPIQNDSGTSQHKSNKNGSLYVGAKVIDKADLNKLKPFVCMRCSKSFATSKHLKIHVQSHEQDKIYGCGICGKKYSTNSILKKHIHKYHLPNSEGCRKKKNN